MAIQNTQNRSVETVQHGAQSAAHSSDRRSTLPPPVDIYETAEGIVLRADMPGVSKDRLDVKVEGNTLLVEGLIGIAPQEEMAAVHAELRAAAYRRQFVLSNELETSRIEAVLQSGVLTVRIPKRAELRPRRIEVRS
jgi:HSP20 family molecular chaperone IbpA